MTKNIRLLSILEKLSNEPKVCVKDLALLYDVSIKSIQNDFTILTEYFATQLLKKGECYTLLNQEHFSNIFRSNPQTIKRFLHLISMVDGDFYTEFIEEHKMLFQELNFTTSPVYQIENSPYEHLKKRES